MGHDSVVYSPYRTIPATADNHHRLAERLLLRVPIFLAVAFGSVYMVGRFILVFSEDLKQRPDSLGAVMLLMMLVGTVSLMVIAACAAVGATIGLFLRAVARSFSGWH
jgi:hypothetical protein